ncbi:acyltransferase [Methanobrevibacter sp.]|uniref:acyltransferase n=1 Tax=Methanobrevibacter sp. TaxID=66852 RepID=UPI0026E0CA6F|nr:acyltransferase [Methanobrevibacter sp.]MDO5823304.1 acyltransferase [Methanobrevibacter sp.]
MNKSKRIFYYDVVRAIAIIGIVFCYVSIYFVLTGVKTPNFYISAFFDCFREFSVPLFVMLSGALLINKKDSLIKFFKKRLSRLLIPFLFWVLIYILYSSLYITKGFNLVNALNIFLGSSGTLGVAFWFIWMIIISYMGIFAVNKLIEFGNKRKENFDEKFINLLALLSFIYILISQFGLFNPYSSKLIYFISFMSYIVIGYFIANNDYIGNKFDSKIILAVAFSVSILLYFYYIFGFVVPQSLLSNHFVYKGYFNLLILTLSVNVFVFFKYLSKTDYLKRIEDNKLGNALTLISEYSFGIYLCHYLVLHILKLNLFSLYYGQNPIIWIPVLVITTTLISLLILWILNRIPYLNKFSGKS